MDTRSVTKSESAQAFTSAAEAWFWAMRALRARREGGGRSSNRVVRPCDPDDVLCCLDRLYRSRRIDLRHARVLCDWGGHQMVPDTRMASGQEALLWREALSELEAPLRDKGIVS